jgi:hypothetical protein
MGEEGERGWKRRKGRWGGSWTGEMRKGKRELGNGELGGKGKWEKDSGKGKKVGRKSGKGKNRTDKSVGRGRSEKERLERECGEKELRKRKVGKMNG